MDILNPETYREEYEALLHSLIQREWTIKMHHSDFKDRKPISRKINPFAFAIFNITPNIIVKEKRMCKVQFKIGTHLFETIIYTPVSISIEEFLTRTYNKFYDIINEELPLEIWKHYDNVVKLDFKQMRSSSI